LANITLLRITCREIAFELLCKACAKGDVPLIRRCAENGADIGAGDYDQRTPLHIAASNGHAAAVDFLIQHNAPVAPRDRWGRTPLLDAATNQHDSIVMALRAVGADIGDSNEIATALGNAAARGDLATIRRLAAAGAALDSIDYDKRCALHIAAANGQLETVEFLVNNGANCNMEDRWGGTPLSEAAHHDKVGVVDFLKLKGATMGSTDLRYRRKKFIGIDSIENQGIAHSLTHSLALVLAHSLTHSLSVL
jgi:ankyrin repeat protein